MGDIEKKLMILLFFIIISLALIHTVSAEDNVRKEIIINTSEISNISNITILEFSKKSDIDAVIEGQRSIDKSLSILNIVATLMGVLVGLISIIIVLSVSFGFFEFKKWVSIRKSMEKDAEIINNLQNKGEIYLRTLRNEIEKNYEFSTEKPSDDVIEKLDEFSNRLEFLEMLGVPLESKDYKNHALDLFYKKKYELAIKMFDKAIELDHNDFVSWNFKGNALYKLDRFEEANKSFDKAIELKPDVDASWSGKGIVHASLKRYDEAVRYFEKSVELAPKIAINWHLKGIALLNLNKYEEALKDFEKAIELNQNNFISYDRKSSALLKLNRYDEAIEASKKAIELKPDYANAFYNCACIYSLKGNKEKTISILKKAIEIDNSYKEKAKSDEDFEKFLEDKDFIELVS